MNEKSECPRCKKLSEIVPNSIGHRTGCCAECNEEMLKRARSLPPDPYYANIKFDLPKDAK